MSLEEVEESETLKQIEDQISQANDDLKTCRTSRLWLQYLDMIYLLQALIRA